MSRDDSKPIDVRLRWLWGLDSEVQFIVCSWDDPVQFAICFHDANGDEREVTADTPEEVIDAAMQLSASAWR